MKSCFDFHIRLQISQNYFELYLNYQPRTLRRLGVDDNPYHFSSKEEEAFLQISER